MGFLRLHPKSFLAIDFLAPLRVDTIRRAMTDSVENDDEVKRLEFPRKINDSDVK